MAITDIGTIDTYVNQGRESLLSLLSGSSLGVRFFFGFLSVIMLFVIIRKMQQGKEEIRGIWGPLAIIIFSISVIFGFSITMIAWILIAVLGAMLLYHTAKGEWQGAVVMLIVIFGLSYIVSINAVMFLMMSGTIVVVGFVISHLKSVEMYGSGRESAARQEAGIPERKERRIIRALGRIAGRGYSWSKDRTLRGVSKFKQRIAEREARNLEEQQHEAAIAAADQKMAKAIEEIETKEEEIEKTDSKYISQILTLCKQLESRMPAKGERVEETAKNEIHSTSKEILSLSGKLVDDKLAEEKLTARANKVIKLCMGVVEDASKEAQLLEESKSVFRELKHTSDSDIHLIEKELINTTERLSKALAEASKSSNETVRTEVKLLAERKGKLEDVKNKLNTVRSQIDKILNRLMQINAKADARINALNNINHKAKQHEKNMEIFEDKFTEEQEKLGQQRKKFGKFYKQESQEIADEQLVRMTDLLLPMLQDIHSFTNAAHEYNEQQLKPLIKEMADQMRTVASLSQEAEELNKTYYWLSRSLEEISKIAEQVDVNLKSKKEFEKISQTAETEAQLEKRAYKKGKFVESIILNSYNTLQRAYDQVARHAKTLGEYAQDIYVLRIETGRILYKAFSILERGEIKQAERLEQEANAAGYAANRALAAERRAKRSL